MSRAFVKEDSEAPPVTLERPVSSAPNLVTPRGLMLIGEEIARLEDEIAAAEDEETAASLRRDLRYWSSRSATAQPVDPDPQPEVAAFATRVSIRRGGSTSEIEIVGEDEADPARNLIAWTSPLARALDQAEPGETVEMSAGGRTEKIEILEVGTLSGD